MRTDDRRKDRMERGRKCGTMRKIIFLLISLVAILLVRAAVLQGSVGTMEKTVDTAQSGSSEISFQGKKEERYRFSYSSTVKEGTLEMLLTDKGGNVLQTYETGISSNREIFMKNDDIYSVVVTYKDFVGNYDVKIEK